MNTDTGRLYELGADFLKAETPEIRSVAEGAEFFTSSREDRLAKLERALTDDEQAYLDDKRKGEHIVPVSPQVAQMVKLGQRELDRRAKRRKAAKQARKRGR